MWMPLKKWTVAWIYQETAYSEKKKKNIQKESNSWTTAVFDQNYLQMSVHWPAYSISYAHISASLIVYGATLVHQTTSTISMNIKGTVILSQNARIYLYNKSWMPMCDYSRFIQVNASHLPNPLFTITGSPTEALLLLEDFRPGKLAIHQCHGSFLGKV